MLDILTKRVRHHLDIETEEEKKKFFQMFTTMVQIGEYQTLLITQILATSQENV